MINTKMSLEQIKNNKEEFLKINGVKDIFDKGIYTWEELIDIGEDYTKKRYDDYLKIIKDYIFQISTFENVHSYRYRIKEADSLIVKILKKAEKRGHKITLDNYFQEITDLLGIRILYLFKEDYWLINEQIMAKFKGQLVENIHLKLRDGDDEKTYQKLTSEYDVIVEKNKAYRSIHYTIYANPTNITSSPKLEIQTRTIFEEGWSEINHKLVYKKEKNLISHLEKTSGILSGLVGSCDSIGSLMKYVYENGITSAEGENDDTIGKVIKNFLCN